MELQPPRAQRSRQHQPGDEQPATVYQIRWAMTEIRNCQAQCTKLTNRVALLEKIIRARGDEPPVPERRSIRTR